MRFGSVQCSWELRETEFREIDLSLQGPRSAAFQTHSEDFDRSGLQRRYLLVSPWKQWLYITLKPVTEAAKLYLAC
jgi:hypothetical protein